MESFFGFSLQALIATAGYAGIFGMLFAESGLLIGFIFPGDSLLLTSGFLASQGYLNIMILAIGSFVAAVLGDNLGYAIGRRAGPKIFKKEDSFFFKKSYVEKTKLFYDRHGGKTLILARFIHGVRAFAPVLAGVANMRYSVFFFYNVAGAALWAVGLSFLGYFLGSALPGIDRYIVLVIVGLVFLFAIPSLFHILREQRNMK